MWTDAGGRRCPPSLCGGPFPVRRLDRPTTNYRHVWSETGQEDSGQVDPDLRRSHFREERITAPGPFQGGLPGIQHPSPAMARYALIQEFR